MPQFMLVRSSMPLGLRHLAQPLEETPAVALEVERLIDAIIPQVIVQPADDLGTRGDRALVVRVDVVDVHGDVLGGGAGLLGLNAPWAPCAPSPIVPSPNSTIV